MRKWLPIFFLLLVIDFLTKKWALDSFYPIGEGEIFSLGGITFSLSSIVNTGAAWGLFSGYAAPLFIIRILIIIALLVFVPKRLPILLILTGAIGNVIDFGLYRHVIDFLHFTFWGYSFPIFNVADSCITIGVLFLLFSSRKAKAIETT